MNKKDCFSDHFVSEIFQVLSFFRSRVRYRLETPTLGIAKISSFFMWDVAG